MMADDRPNSYHLAIFACCRELEKKQYEYMSKSEVEIILERQERVKIERKLEELEW